VHHDHLSCVVNKYPLYVPSRIRLIRILAVMHYRLIFLSPNFRLAVTINWRKSWKNRRNPSKFVAM
jgi:hypothetical protein